MYQQDEAQLAYFLKYVRKSSITKLKEFTRKIFHEVGKECSIEDTDDTQLCTTDDLKKIKMALDKDDFIEGHFVKVSVTLNGYEGVTKYKDVPAVSLSSFIGTLGGILNLWVGLSFITVIELMELLMNICGKLMKVRKQKLMAVVPCKSQTRLMFMQ